MNKWTWVILLRISGNRKHTRYSAGALILSSEIRFSSHTSSVNCALLGSFGVRGAYWSTKRILEESPFCNWTLVYIYEPNSVLPFWREDKTKSSTIYWGLSEWRGETKQEHRTQGTITRFWVWTYSLGEDSHFARGEIFHYAIFIITLFWNRTFILWDKYVWAIVLSIENHELFPGMLRLRFYVVPYIW